MSQDYVKSGIRVATSRTAQRTVLQTVLLVCGSTILLGLSSIAYILFYNNYLPDQITTIPLHLQYGTEKPYAVASLANCNIKDSQAYDVTVELKLPRSPANLERGNFMLSLDISSLDNDRLSPTAIVDAKNSLYSESRPALMPYTDPLVSLASRILFMPYYMVYSTSDTTRLAVQLAEKASFKASRLPTALLVQLDTGSELPLRTYSASITFTAQLSGLRWLMHRHWFLSFFLLTTMFWLCSIFFMFIGWMAISLCFGGTADTTVMTVKSEAGAPAPGKDYGVGEYRQIKKEEEEEEARTPVTPRTPASYSTTRGPPPSYQSGSTRASKKPVSGGQGSSSRDFKASGEDWDGGGGEDERAVERWKKEYSTMASSDYDESRGEGLRRRSSSKSLSGC